MIVPAAASQYTVPPHFKSGDWITGQAWSAYDLRKCDSTSLGYRATHVQLTRISRTSRHANDVFNFRTEIYLSVAFHISRRFQLMHQYLGSFPVSSQCSPLQTSSLLQVRPTSSQCNHMAVSIKYRDRIHQSLPAACESRLPGFVPKCGRDAPHTKQCRLFHVQFIQNAKVADTGTLLATSKVT